MIKNFSTYIGNKKQYYSDLLEGNPEAVNLFNEVVQFKCRHVETQLSPIEMAMKVARECVETCQKAVKKEDIGVVIFTSNIPLKCVPSTAITIAGELGLRKENLIAFDLNSNCSGALTALNTAKNLLGEKSKYALIVAVDKFSMAENENCYITYSYGDAATCMIIDKEFDRYYFSQDCETKFIDEMQLPLGGVHEGMNNMIMSVIGNPSFEEVASLIKPQFDRMLSETGLKVSDFEAFCLTQGSGKILEGVTNILNLDVNKVPFTGAKTGYTGVCCPLLNLWYLVNKEGMKRGDLLFFWSLGAGINSTMCVFEY